ncbi:dihydrofolate reductase family protein [Paractinoplanes hotanensis]|uniref:Dihydrofolate reductase family protein n=1 Tax=Paractinoplanes hotanensis TaxID=2906497 RepID=A0ABT0XQL8_9ACTN|nr:dihydrofolate reductase family protein [Actinoplanes hotanensis]MCM4076075.1 dihydrofolate reductase family protein [Actinoplanes hotanensis]
MRKLVLYSLVSLDGVGESPDEYVFEFDETMHTNLGEVIRSQDTVLLGRVQYDEWASYWPTSDMQPFADFINNVPKYVFTSAQPAADWTGTTIVTTDAVDFVGELKEHPGGEIGLHGSLSLSRSLLAANLVDQIRLVVFPTLAGRGRKLFDDDATVRKLKLQRAEPTPSGGLLLDYEFSRP